jgi:hypothetical protein
MIIKCDVCLENQSNPAFTHELRCGHTYCSICKYKRRELIRENICLVCLVDEKKYTKDEIEKFTFKNLPWAKMRFEDVKF